MIRSQNGIELKRRDCQAEEQFSAIMDKTKLKSYIQNNQRELRVAIRQQIQSYGPLGPVQHKRVPLKQQVKEEQQRLLDIRKKNAKQFNSNILLNKTQFSQKQQGAKRNWDASKMQLQS